MAGPAGERPNRAIRERAGAARRSALRTCPGSPPGIREWPQIEPGSGRHVSGRDLSPWRHRPEFLRAMHGFLKADVAEEKRFACQTQHQRDLVGELRMRAAIEDRL